MSYDQKNENREKSKYEATYKRDYESDYDIHKNYIQQDFDSYEAIL